jgi:hypothetical protein
VVVHDLDIPGITIAPGEADPVLPVDPDRVLPFPVTRERFEAVGRGREVARLLGCVELVELRLRSLPERRGQALSCSLALLWAQRPL